MLLFPLLLCLSVFLEDFSFAGVCVTFCCFFLFLKLVDLPSSFCWLFLVPQVVAVQDGASPACNLWQPTGRVNLTRGILQTIHKTNWRSWIIYIDLYSILCYTQDMLRRMINIQSIDVYSKITVWWVKLVHHTSFSLGSQYQNVSTIPL